MALATNPLQSFLWGEGGTIKTPEQVERDRQIADALLKEGADYSPIASWTQGAARLADALSSVVHEHRADSEEQAGMAQAKANFGDKIAALLSGTGAPASVAPAAAVSDVAPAVVASPAGAVPATPSYQDAIASIESDGSGGYSAVGPTNAKLGRPLGKYQVMEANLPEWSKEALGYTVTPGQFLASPQLQDAVFNHQFGKYVSQFGPEGAAEAWFAGPGGVGKLTRSDSLGTTVGDYASKFDSALGQPGADPTVADRAQELRQYEATPTAADAATAQAVGGQLPPIALPVVASPAAPQSPGDLIPLLLQASGDPWAEKQYGPVIGALLGEQLKERANAADPLRQLQIQSAEADLANAPIDRQMKLAQLGLTQAKVNGGFYGDSDTAAAQRIIMTGDPASKQYAIAYQELYGPKTQQQQTPNGIITFQLQNPPPAGVAPPTFGGAAGLVAPGAPSAVAPGPATQPSSQPSQDAPQSSTPMSMVIPPDTALPDNVLPNTAPFNESQSRATDLARMAIPDLKTAIDNYSALTNSKDQILQKDPTGLLNGLKDPQYQRAYNATRSAISNILYTVSGAAIGDKELDRKIQDLTPQFGDQPLAVSDKLNRLANYVTSMAAATKDPATIAWAKQAIAGIEAAQDSISSKIPLPPGVSEEDMAYTMKKYGMTRAQVLEKLSAP